jgi:HlyD family secretion protein
MWRHLRSPRLWFGLGVVILLVVVGLWPTAVPADFATVTRGPLRVTIDEEGETRVRERFVVSAPVSGRVLRIELEPGDPVKRHDTVLASFLPGAPTPLDVRSRAAAEARVEAARAALGRARAVRAGAQAQLTLSQKELARHRELARAEVTSRSELETREVAARTAEEAARAAEFAESAAAHELEMAQAELLPVAQASGTASQVLRLRSPIDGVVLRRLRQSEAVVPAGEPLVEVGDPRAIEIVSDLLSTNAVKVRPGQPVLIEQWGGERPLRGRVRRVEPSGFMKVSALGVEEQRVNVIVDFDDPVEAFATLGDGYRVEVRIVTWERGDVLKLPTSSLFRRGERWAVFAVDEGHARLREVEIGQRNGLEAEVRSGVQPGETVVVHPSDALADGARVARRAS